MTAIIASALFATTAVTSNPWIAEWDTPYGMPPFKELKICDYVNAIRTGVNLKQERIKAIAENKEAPTFKNTIIPYIYADKELTQASRAFGVQFSLERDEEREKASIEAIPIFTDDTAKTISTTFSRDTTPPPITRIFGLKCLTATSILSLRRKATCGIRNWE
jgi:hypothetical protein